MPDIPATPRTTLHRRRGRGSHDRDLIHAILDAGLVCHVGFVDGGQPYVLPTTYARVDDRIYLHGSTGNRMLRALAAGAPACLTVTLLDGIVFARSAFHHSMNYRSVVVLGTATEVAGLEERRLALAAIVEHVARGRSSGCRPPTDAEVDGTRVVALPVHEASAKVRAGPPVDDQEDLALGWWAGVLPLRVAPGAPEPDPALRPGIPVPESVLRWRPG